MNLPDRLHELRIQSFIVIVKVNPSTKSGNSRLKKKKNIRVSRE